MYNPEIKTRFIVEKYNTHNSRMAAERVFTVTGEFERLYDKDLCDFDITQAQNVFDHISGRRGSTTATSLSIVRSYLRWCTISLRREVTDAFYKITTPDLEIVRNTMVGTPGELAAYLDAVFQSSPDSRNVECTYRCYYWLAFMGLTEPEAFSVRTSDIDLENMEVLFDGARLEMYRESYPYFRNAVKLDAFEYRHPLYLHRPPAIKKRLEGDLLLRGIEYSNSDGFKGATIRNEVLKRRNQAKKDGRVERQLSYYNIMHSGAYYRAYELERAGFEYSLRDFAAQTMHGELSQDPKEMKRKIDARERMILQDYRRWKLVFSIV